MSGISRLSVLPYMASTRTSIDVEVDFSGIQERRSASHTVGLPDAAVRESRDRVRAAIKNSGYLDSAHPSSPSISLPPI